MLVYLNGEFLPKADAKLSVDDRGFLFGDGVYEVTRVVDGELFGGDGHWERLQRGLREIHIDASGISREKLDGIYRRLIEESDLGSGHATVYLQITRGAAPRSHPYPKPPVEPTVYAFASRFEIPFDLRESGVRAITVPDVRWSRCDIKTVNLLPNTMAKQRAKEAGAWEAILVRDGVLMEGAASNLFAVFDGELRTHPKTNSILPGITRDIVLDLARGLNIPIKEVPIFQHELPSVDELFFTGTTTDVQPIVDVDGDQVADGKVGPISRRLLEALMEKMGVAEVASA